MSLAIATLAVVISLASWCFMSMGYQELQTDLQYNKPNFLNFACNLSVFPVSLIYGIWAYRNPDKRVTLQEVRQSLRESLILSPFVIISGYGFIRSLVHTSLSVNTLIFNAEPAFIFLFSIFILPNYRASLSKVVPPLRLQHMWFFRFNGSDVIVDVVTGWADFFFTFFHHASFHS